MKRIAGVLLVILLLLLPTAQAFAGTAGVDLLLIVAHPGDEYLYLGGVIPYYGGECGYTLAIVYMTGGNDAAQENAARSLAALGVDAAPIFLSFPDVYAETLEKAQKYWDEKDAIALLQAQIEALRPAVVVTHGANGEYGHGMHRLTAEATLKAVKKAAGVWQVQRVYQHLTGSDQVVIDRSTPLVRYQGMTALEADRLGYQNYAPDPRYAVTVEDTGYTRPSYGVVYSASGDLAQVDHDLFTGVDRAFLTGPNYAVPAPTPTEAPTNAPAPTKTPLDAPTASPEAVDAPAASPAPAARPFLLALAAFISALSAVLILVLSRKTKKGVLLRLLGAILLLLAAALLLLYFRQPSDRQSLAANGAVSAAPATATPTPAPAVTPLPAPTATDTPAPTVTPHPWEEYFRAEGEPDEVVVIDPENGHWEYRTNALSILIDRYQEETADGRPIVYCVAHIRQKDGESAFRAGMRDPGSVSSRGLEQPWHMARRLKAVLAVTGDNMTQAETSIKGILMRDGKVYSDNQAADTLALYPDLTLRIFSPNETTPEQLLADGVQNTFSFGPTLIRDGVINEGGTRTKLGATNPRCGIGMVEPGHFIVITVDGRQREHSQGISIGEFMHLFYVYGCTQAYNLDGGSSTAMVFMGEHLNKHGDTGSDFQRGWPDAILFGCSGQVPTVDDPISNKGYGEPG